MKIITLQYSREYIPTLYYRIDCMVSKPSAGNIPYHKQNNIANTGAIYPFALLGYSFCGNRLESGLSGSSI